MMVERKGKKERQKEEKKRDEAEEEREAPITQDRHSPKSNLTLESTNLLVCKAFLTCGDVENICRTLLVIS